MTRSIRLFLAYITFAIVKHVVPLQRLARMASLSPSPTRDREAERGVIATVARLRRWLNSRDDCLEGSLVLYRELSSLGANPTLAVGFRKNGDRLEGHAWILVDGAALPGESHDFQTLFQFGAGGALISDTTSASDLELRETGV